MHFVNQWYDTIVGRTRNYGPHNSFVAPHAHWEYQIDLFQLAHLGSGNSTDAMACIDVFSRYATVVPISSKQKNAYVRALGSCFRDMGRPPKFIMSDAEGAFLSKEVQKYLEEVGITPIITHTHAQFVDYSHIQSHVA